MTDLRYAVRWLFKHPGFSAIVVMTLALGIGANTAVFSITDALFLRPLPVRHADRLVLIDAVGAEGRTTFSANDLLAMQRDARGFESLAAHGRGGTIFRDSVDKGGADQWIVTDFVAGPYFETLGVSPARGRLLVPADDRAGDPVPIVLSDTFWRQHFHRDESVIGRVASINGAACMIVGIAPPEFFGVMVGTSPEVWAPHSLVARTYRTAEADRLKRANESRWMHAFGALAPDASGAPGAPGAPGASGTASASGAAGASGGLSASREAARLSLRQIWQQGDTELAARTPLVGSLDAWQNFFAERYRASLQILFGLVSVILLVACVNVVSLVMTRAAGRQKEVAIRVALGIGRARLVRQLLTEYLLLAAAAMIVALPIGAWLAGWLVSLGSQPYLPLIVNVDPNRRVLLFAALVTLAVGTAVGIWPALRAARLDPNAALHATAATAGSARLRRLSGAWALLPVQIALGVVLLVAASLLVRSLAHLRGGLDEIDPQHLIFASISTEAAGYDAARDRQFAEQLPQRLAELPGIDHAALTSERPLVDSSSGPIAVDGGSAPARTDQKAFFDYVSPHYFDTLGVALLRGRDFTHADRQDAPLVAIVNERLTQQLFGGSDALGRTIRVGAPARPAQIVGIVRDNHLDDLRKSVQPTVFLPLASRRAFGGFEVAVRTRLPAGVAIEQMRQALRTMDPRLPLVRGWTFEQEISNALSKERMIAFVASGFGALALLLVAIGVFGALSYAVARRSRELGVRVALGASPSRLRGMVVRESLAVAGLGLAAGLPLAWITARTLQSSLHGVQPLDPLTMTGVALVVLGSTSLAAWLPARRAARVDPITALRAE
jgi:putative ABC transport system permease protein